MWAAFVAISLGVAPVVAQERALPPVVVQTAPIGKGIEDVRAMAKLFAPTLPAEAIFGELERNLGEKGFEGIDTKKPLLGYLFVPDNLGGPMAKFDDDLPEATLMKFKGVVLVPFTKPEEFRGFMTRVSGGEAQLAGIEEHEGLFKLDMVNDPAPFPMRVRYIDGYAYIGINLTDEEMDAKSLVPPQKLLKDKEAAQFAVRVYPDRLPAGFVKEAIGRFDGAVKELQARAGDKPSPPEVAAISLLGLWRTYQNKLATEAEEFGYRQEINAEAGEQSQELYVVPKPNSALAKEIAARKASTNRFATLVAPDAVIGVYIRLPLFDAAIRDTVCALLRDGGKQLREQVPPPGHTAFDEAIVGLTKTVKTGEFDVAAALLGPDKDGHYTSVLAVAYEDGPALEQALRGMLKAMPPERQKPFTLDVAKAAGLAVHTYNVPEVAPEVMAIYGSKTLHFAFGLKGIYVAFGKEGLAKLQAAASAKPGEAKVLDVRINPKRLAALLAKTKANLGELLGKEHAGELLGKAFVDDKLVPAFGISVDGGSTLRIRLSASTNLYAALFALVE